MIIHSAVVLLLAFLALSGLPDRARAETRDPSSLKGLGRSLCIVVEEPDTDAQRAGLTAEKLKAVVEEVFPTRDPGLGFKAPTGLHGTVGTWLSGRLEPAVLATAAGSVAVFADEYQLVNSGP
ncbi:MAG: hypothetical protein HY900_04615 [Deltaproteobacteria bacterium]|nr:hypothetical protein [Deltaproteobacteria bacterium]